ncbi:MAG: matrixin family metalloprotease [Rhodobacterales bacterium]|nr:matrixin family metalloprotease [Rhodobacterales bacterium]
MTRIPDDTTTTATLALGETFAGTLESAGDRDWVRVTLTQGETVELLLFGRGDGALEDPFLRLYDAGGTLLEFNDDFGAGYDSGLIFTPKATGIYYIEAAAYDDGGAGDYTISFAPGIAPTDPLRAIDWGTAQPDTTVTVAFLARGIRQEGYTGEGFNAYEIARFKDAFALIEEVCGLRFNVVSGRNADLRLLLDTNEVAGEFLGYFNPPGEENAGAAVFDGAQWDRRAGGDLERGGYGFVTIVHELLHGLGLAHPHDSGNGASEIMPGVSDEFDDYGDHNLNQGIFTIMSYNSGYFTGTPGSTGDGGFQYGYEAGPMALDISLLQEKYGTRAHAAGDTVYRLPTQNSDGAQWRAIWDTSGRDEIRHDGTGSAVINLRAATLLYEEGGGGFVSAQNGVAGGFTIAAGVVIENATGGRGADVITGNSAANILTGRAGADRIYAGAGADTVAGGAGRDQLFGGDLNDTLRGDGKADRIAGGEGGDLLRGGAGRDVFIYTDAADSFGNTAARDTISDFRRGADRIDLSRIDANGEAAGDGAFAFIGQAGFDGRGAGSAGQLRFQTGPGSVLVQADIDGDGLADMSILLANLSQLGAADFIL